MFDITVQGEEARSGLDVSTEGDHGVGLTETASSIRVIDGVLTVSLETRVDNSTFSGIGIREAGGTE